MLMAPMIKVEETAQATDVAASKAPSKLWKGYARIKTYVKDDEFSIVGSPRTFAFEQPYQIASRCTGRPWTDTNPVYLGELHGCNIRCPYCYLDWASKATTIEVSPHQYAEDFFAFNEAEIAAGRTGSAVLRWSGGEPMLFQEWLACSIAHFADECGLEYGWLDTNLTIAPTDALLDAMTEAPMGVCGCFKPGVDGVDLDEQLSIAGIWIERSPTKDIFFCDIPRGKPRGFLGHPEATGTSSRLMSAALLLRPLALADTLPTFSGNR